MPITTAGGPAGASYRPAQDLPIQPPVSKNPQVDIDGYAVAELMAGVAAAVSRRVPAVSEDAYRVILGEIPELRTSSAGASCVLPGRPGRARPVRAPARARAAAAAMAGAKPALNAAAEV